MKVLMLSLTQVHVYIVFFYISMTVCCFFIMLQIDVFVNNCISKFCDLWLGWHLFSKIAFWSLAVPKLGHSTLASSFL